MLSRFLQTLDRFRKPLCALLLVVLAVCAYFTTRLQILDSPERWMPASTLAAWHVFESHFDAGDTVGIGLHFKRPVTDGDLALLKGLRERLQAVEGIQSIYDCGVVAEQIERVPLTELLDPANGKRFALYEGVLWNTPDPQDPTRTLMIAGELVFNPSEDKENPDKLNNRRRHVVAAVDAIIADEQQSGRWENVDFHVASGIKMMGELEKRTRRVAWTFLPISLALGLAAFLWCFQSWRAVLVASLGSAIATLLVLGWLGAGGGTLGVVTMTAPALIAIIGTASTIHFAAYAAETGSSGEGLARGELIRWVAVPCLGAAVTTGIGFFMLRFNELLPVRDMGAQVCLGSILSFFGVFFVSQWIPIRRTRAKPWLNARRLDVMGRGIIARPKLVVGVLFAAMALCVFLAWPRNKEHRIGLYVDADPFSFFANDQPIKIALNHFSQRRFAVFQLEAILIPKNPGQGSRGLEPPDAQFLANAEAAQKFSDAMAKRGDLGVIRVFSTLSLNQRYEEFLNEFLDRSGEEGPLAALMYFAPKASGAASLQQTFRAWTNDKQKQGALRLTFMAHDTPDGFAPLVEYARSQLPTEHFDCYLAGSAQQNVDLTNGLSTGMINGLGTALIIMIVLTAFLFRSVKLALIAMTPNVFPIICVYGLMGVFKMPISSGSAMVATIALGIALNDTIHFMMQYQKRTREEGLDSRAAILETTITAGRPLILTSLVHTAGFLIFLTTDFLPLFHFGLLASIAMLATLVGDLVLLPNLLLLLDRHPARAPRDAGSPDEARAEAAAV